VIHKKQILENVVNQRRIVILGSRGMLGQMVLKYFLNAGFDVISFDQRFNESNYIEYIDKLNTLPDAFVVNCIVRISQKSTDPMELLLPNAILPLELSRKLKATHVLVQPSTDCVFNGTKDGFYDADYPHNAIDAYGWSKSLGESAVLVMRNSFIIRVSIIGLDKNSTKGLLSWFLSNPAKTRMNGYSNIFWNGVTTLEWSRKLHEIITSTSRLSEIIDLKVIQLGTREKYSKYDMLQIFQKIFCTDFIIQSTETKKIDRCLKPKIMSSSLKLQLEELKKFNDK
jgi:dTDP-4-dehydrorhamnose reductase